MHNPEKDAAQMAANRERLLEAGYKLFNARTIESVSLEQIARAAGIGVATLYRYFGNKTDLAIAISVWKWNEYLQELTLLSDAGERENTGRGREDDRAGKAGGPETEKRGFAAAADDGKKPAGGTESFKGPVHGEHLPGGFGGNHDTHIIP